MGNFYSATKNSNKTAPLFVLNPLAILRIMLPLNICIFQKCLLSILSLFAVNFASILVLLGLGGCTMIKKRYINLFARYSAVLTLIWIPCFYYYFTVQSKTTLAVGLFVTFYLSYIIFNMLWPQTISIDLCGQSYSAK